MNGLSRRLNRAEERGSEVVNIREEDGKHWRA